MYGVHSVFAPPFPSGINDVVIPVFDNEPSSVIAYCLSSRQYQQVLNDSIKACFTVRSVNDVWGGVVEGVGWTRQYQQVLNESIKASFTVSSVNCVGGWWRAASEGQGQRSFPFSLL